MDNGGPTPTIAIGADSPALDLVPILECTDVDGVPVLTDQRTVDRPQPVGGKCDAGAFELAQAAPSIQDIIDLFDALAASGALLGIGPGASAETGWRLCATCS